MMSELPQLISHSEAIDILGISDPTFYRLVRRGFIPKVRLPGKTYGRYRKSDVEEMAKALTVEDGPEERQAKQFLKQYLEKYHVEA